MSEGFDRYLVPVLVIIIAGLAGFVVDRVLVSRIRSMAAARGWRGGEATAHSVSGMNAVLGALAGTWFAIEMMDLPERVARIAGTWLFVAVIAAVTVVAVRLASAMTRLHASRDDTALPAGTILVNIARILVIALGVLVALNALGVSITPLLTALGVGGLAVALALQDTLSNLFSGLQLVGSKQINVGEYISLESGEEGYVEDITWRFTSIRQLSNNLVIVPNAKLANSRIVNYHATAKEMSVLAELGVAYDSDLALVEAVTIETAKEVTARLEGEFPDFEPFVRFHTFGDSAIQFTVILRVREFTNQYLLKHEFVKAIKTRYEAEGIDIPFPQRTVTVTDSRVGPG